MKDTIVYWTLRASNNKWDRDPITIAAPTREEALALAESYEYKSNPIRHAVRNKRTRETLADLYASAQKAQKGK